MKQKLSKVIVIVIIAVVIQSCSQSVTVYKAKHPRDPKIYDAWVKYSKNTINPYCQHDYIRGAIIDQHAKPIIGVEISAEGIKATTSSDGKFYLIIPDDMNLNKRVTFECSGYRKIQLITKNVTCRELVVRMQETIRKKE